MSQIRASINFSHRKKQSHTCDTKFNQSSATPINENTDESSELNTDLDNTDVDEEQDIEPSNLTSTDDWENQLRDWEQMLIDEETARLEEEEEERDNHYDYMDDDLLSDYKHPALDDRAKWELSSIFSTLFQKLNYMNNES